MLTYGIFLFLSIFPIIHPKGLAQMPEENMAAIILTCKKRRRDYELQLQPIIQKGRGIYQP